MDNQHSLNFQEFLLCASFLLPTFCAVHSIQVPLIVHTFSTLNWLLKAVCAYKLLAPMTTNGAGLSLMVIYRRSERVQ